MTIGQQHYAVETMEGYEALGEPFHYRVTGVLAAADALAGAPSDQSGACADFSAASSAASSGASSAKVPTESVVGSPALLSWGNGDCGQRQVSGVVTYWCSGDSEPELALGPLTGQQPHRYTAAASGCTARRFTAIIEPRLVLLDGASEQRLYSPVDLATWVPSVLAEVGYPKTAIEWRVPPELSARRYVLQADESRWALLQRLLARLGIYYAWIGAGSGAGASGSGQCAGQEAVSGGGLGDESGQKSGHGLGQEWDQKWGDRSACKSGDQLSDDGDERLRFVVDSADLPVRRRPLRVAPPGAVAAALVGVDEAADDGGERASGEEKGAVANRSHPGYDLAGVRLVRRAPPTPAAVEMRAAARTDCYEEAVWLQRVRAERAQAAAYQVHAWGPCADLSAGLNVCIEGECDDAAGALRSGVEGRHLITAVRHRLRIDGAVGDCYTAEITALPELNAAQVLHYRPPEPPPQPRPLVMQAEVVGAPTGYGGVAVRLPGVPPAVTQAAVAGAALPRLVPYAAPAVQRAGWQTPLLPGHHILVSCFNHDPDLPIILGVIPTDQERHLAGRSYGRDGGYVTAAGQGLSLHGAGLTAAAGSRLLLHGPQQANCLEMAAGQGGSDGQRGQGGQGMGADRVHLRCRDGALRLESAIDQSESCGGDYQLRVTGCEHLQLHNGSAYNESAANVRYRLAGSAAGSVTTGGVGVTGSAGQDLAWRSGRALTVDVSDSVSGHAEHGMEFTATAGDVTAAAPNGAMVVRAGAGVALTSIQGTVTLANAAQSAGVTVSATGALCIWGERIVVSGETAIALRGERIAHSSAR
ncbi:hypothetical protein CKO15_01935 [Halorhodospira abdelmalekii]|nr:hypothetical protein [Halorhodospira abdelmalekii]